MPKKQPKPKSPELAPDSDTVQYPPPRPALPTTPDEVLEEAKKESKRKLITDHIAAIKVLRDEKRFTFREIADWLGKRGFITDHSAVYRAYLSAIPEENRDPREDWSDVDLPE